jgi:hypothetical protein
MHCCVGIPPQLAPVARYHARACLEGARQGYRTARTELAESIPPHALDGVLAAYRTEGYKLAATARAVDAPCVARTSFPGSHGGTSQSRQPCLRRRRQDT